jgi:ubiquinone/menaquinone biosynthesis C-methylase UbiE
MSNHMARFHDTVMGKAEAASLRQWRGELLGGVWGEVLEIGAATGANLTHYPSAVSRLVVTEPNASMRARLPEGIEAIDASVEELPFEDESFDAVVSTLVLCSVRDVEAALAEIRRVLRPGGRFIFIEHVASHDPSILRWQRLANPAWRVMAGNCHLTRDTATSIASAGFAVQHREAAITGVFRLARPSIRGIAIRT